MSVLLVVFGYGCGSVPWGLLLARRAGIDVRRTGSGNIGATNVARSAGIRLGLATLAADALKGAVPVLVARALGAAPALEAAVGVAAFLGHVFPVALRFAGGKGVATALGVLVVVAPGAVACATLVFLPAFLLFRYVSLASMLAAATVPAAVLLMNYPRSTLLASLTMTTIIVVRHRANLSRLLSGTEPRFMLHKKRATP